VPNDEDTLAHPEQPRFLLSAWMWAVALFVFFGVIVAIAFSAMPRGSTYEQDRARARAEKLKTAEEGWSKTMSSYGWVDKAKGVARIPIDRAMQLELSDLQAKKPAPAGPIATPPPAEAPVTATGAPQPTNPPVAAPPTTSPTPPPISQEGPNSEIRGQPAAAANPPDAVPRHSTRRFRDPGRRAKFADRSSAGFTHSHSGAAPDRHSPSRCGRDQQRHLRLPPRRLPIDELERFSK
jgi:hypothetical protein